MFNNNNNNIYKLIKRAKDEKCISDDPMKRIIQNPIKFVYSFTLNSKNEPCSEELQKINDNQNINQNSTNKYNKSLKNKEKKESKENKERIINNNNQENKDIILHKNSSNQKIEVKNDKLLESKNSDKKQNNYINNINKFNQKNNKNQSDQKKKINDKIEKNFINKKRINNNNEENKESIKKKDSKNKNKSSNVVKNNIIHQIYNSKNINLWENDDDSDDNNNNDDKNKEKKNENILPIHKQIEFIHKSENTFKKHDVAVKSEYDKDLDKGRIKKIHKNKIGFKKHKNYFQKISNKKIKWQNKNKD